MNCEEIKTIRKGFLLTREEFSRILDVSSQTIYFWENGTTSPSRFDLVVLYRMKELFHLADREKYGRELKKISRIPNAMPLVKSPYEIKTDLKNSRLGALLFFLFSSQ